MERTRGPGTGATSSPCWPRTASSITLHGLEQQRQALPDLAFRRYHANQWTSAESAWLPADAWQACVDEPRFTEGERIWVGVDVGGERSATAVCWVNDALHVGAGILLGDGAILDVADLVRALARRYQVVELAFDPWRAGQLAQELERKGMTVSVFPQSVTRTSPHRPPWSGGSDAAAAVPRLRPARAAVTLPDLPDQARPHEPLHNADVAAALAGGDRTRRRLRPVRCGAHAGLQAHHVIPRAEVGPDALRNCIALCVRCHGRETAAERNR